MSKEKRKRTEQTDEELREQLTCPICFELFTSTVMCPSGHTICRACFIKLPSRPKPECPICRSPYKKESQTNGIFQELMQKVIVECKYKPSGCTKTIPLSEKVTHEERCEFNIEFLCPFHLFEEGLRNTCRKPVTAHTVQRHLLRKHKLQDIVQSRNTAELTFDHIRIYDECEENQLIATEDLRYLVTATTARGDDFDIVISMLDNRSLERFAIINFEEKGHFITLIKPLRRPVADQVQRAVFTICESEITEYIDDESLKFKITIRSAVP